MSAKACRILIVDDSPEDRELYCRRLTQGLNGGYQFDQAEHGEEGLQLGAIPFCGHAAVVAADAPA